MPTCPYCEYQSDDASEFEFRGTEDEPRYAVRVSRENQTQRVLVVCPECDKVLGGGPYTV